MNPNVADGAGTLLTTSQVPLFPPFPWTSFSRNVVCLPLAQFFFPNAICDVTRTVSPTSRVSNTESHTVSPVESAASPRVKPHTPTMHHLCVVRLTATQCPQLSDTQPHSHLPTKSHTQRFAVPYSIRCAAWCDITHDVRGHRQTPPSAEPRPQDSLHLGHCRRPAWGPGLPARRPGPRPCLRQQDHYSGCISVG